MNTGRSVILGIISWIAAVAPCAETRSSLTPSTSLTPSSLTQSSSPLATSQSPQALEVKAIVRMSAEDEERHQVFRGPAQASKRWHLCVVLPNVSDRFWDEVALGIEEESARLGVTSIIYEATGYSDAGITQQERILLQRCGTAQIDAILLSAVTRTGLHKAIKILRDKNIKVIDFINGYEPQHVDARSLLDNYYLGKMAGTEVKRYLAAHVKKQTPNVLWVPGPEGPLAPDWAQRGDEGFRAAMSDTGAQIKTLYFRPHFREQHRDLRRHLQDGKDYDFIVGTGSTSTAIYQLKKEGIVRRDMPVFAYYATPDALTLLAKNQIIGTISNEPKMQGRMGVALAVGILEKMPMPFQIGPEPVLLTPPLISEPDSTPASPSEPTASIAD